MLNRIKIVTSHARWVLAIFGLFVTSGGLFFNALKR